MNKYKKIFLISLLLGLFNTGFGQVNKSIKLYYSDSLQFINNNKTILNPFVGGLDIPVFSQVDLNNDGKPDIVIFDRSGGVVLTFINTGTTNNFNYEYAPQYEYLFNDLNTDTYILFRDYNQDGKPDIFTLEGTSRKFRIYKNITQPHDTILQLKKLTNDLYFEHTTGAFSRLGGRYSDLPILDDIDGDGDIDYITYETTFGNLQFFLNEQVEKGLPADSFAFRLVDLCWGGFQEDKALGNGIVLECNRAWFPNHVRRDDDFERRHNSGSTLFSIDIDNDGDKELIMGNGIYQNLLFLKNGKSDFGLHYDTMIEYKTHFPSNDEHEILMKYIPALYHFDVDGDGEKDLIAAPYFGLDLSSGSHSSYSDNVWFLKNEGSDKAPYFRVHNKNFLMDESIDLGTNVSPVFWDIDNDGLVDLLVAVEPDTVKSPDIAYSKIYRYNNVGTSKLPVFELVDTDFADFSSFKQIGVTIAIGDIDNDGLADMVIGNKEGKLLFFKNTSENINTPNPSFFLKNNNLLNESVGLYAAPAIFDYNQDGKPDLIIGKQDGYFAYYKNISTDENITFTKITDRFGNARANLYRDNYNPPGYESIGMSAPVFFDFEGDGKPEMISGSNSGHIKMWYISYDPFFTFPEITDFYGLVNANSDTSWNVRLGSSIKVAVSSLRDNSSNDVLIGTNRGGFKFLSSNAGIKRIGVKNVPNSIYNLKVHPNPNNGNFTIDIPLELSNKAFELRIHNYIGKLIKTNILDKNSEHTFKFEAPNGIYIGTLIDETGFVIGTCKILISN